MSSSKLHLMSYQIGQSILNSTRIPHSGLRKKSAFSTSGLELTTVQSRNYSPGTLPSGPGSGAGRGGGGGGSVRESGGGLGQYAAAHEEEFFYNKQREQLEKMKMKLKKEQHKSPEIPQKSDK